MWTFMVAFLVSLCLGAALTFWVRQLAYRRGWVDGITSSRKIHVKPIPRLGGLGIVLAFYAPLLALGFVNSEVGRLFYLHTDLVLALFVGGFVIAGLGLYDDLRGANARLKFVVQFGVALWLWSIGFRIEVIANPFGPVLDIGWLSLPLTLLWLVGVTNAMNLIDGLDGLAGGVAFIAVGTNFVLALARGDVLLSLVMAALAGAILGFLIFNFNPASIFMGDTGSMFLGFVLATVSLKTTAKSGTAVAILIPIIALGLPIMDTMLAIIRRALLGRPLFSADKEHIHHRLLNRLFMSQRKAVLFLYGLCLVFAFTALGLNWASAPQSAMMLFALGAVLFVVMRRLGYLDLRQTTGTSSVRRRNVELRSLVRSIIHNIRHARSVQELWDSTRLIVSSVRAQRIQLKLGSESVEEQVSQSVVFESESSEPGHTPIELAIDIRNRDQIVGRLVVAWNDGREHVNRDEELALELIADALGESLAAMSARANAPNTKVIALRR